MKKLILIGLLISSCIPGPKGDPGPQGPAGQDAIITIVQVCEKEQLLCINNELYFMGEKDHNMRILWPLENGEHFSLHKCNFVVLSNCEVK